MLLSASLVLEAAYLKNYPVTVTQPDGTMLKLFVTGDEYHHRVHDGEGYTLLRHPQTGYVVYAVLENDSLEATSYIYGQADPQRLQSAAPGMKPGIVPNLDISPAKKRQLWERFRKAIPVQAGEQPQKAVPKTAGVSSLRTGTLNNIVIYIAFQDETFTRTKSQFETIFMDETPGASLFSYYRDISNNTFDIPSTFCPEQNRDNTVVYYQDTHSHNYYMAYNSTTNPEGYTSESEGYRRLHAMFYAALNSVKGRVESALTGSDLDYDGDNKVDNICFVVSGDVGEWSDVLWPHRWQMYYLPEAVEFNGKQALDYNLIIENHLFTAGNGLQSVLVHETYHTLGAPDLYTGYNDLEPVGPWDVMATNTIPPQSSSAYITNKYGRFTGDIPEITQSGTYTLYDIWDRAPGHTIAYKIASPTSPSGEFFVLEYRRKNGGSVYESQIPNSGIIISRINPGVTDGNMGAEGTEEEPYEVYVYRQDGTNTSNGQINQAFFSSSGRTEFSDTSSPGAFLTDNSAGLGGIVINQFSAANRETMTFHVAFPSGGAIPVAAAATNVKYTGFTANWNPMPGAESYRLGVYYKNGQEKVYAGGGFQDQDVSNGVSYNVTGLDRSLATTWYYSMKAVSGGMPSDESNEIEVQFAADEVIDYEGIVCEYMSNIGAEESLTYYSLGSGNGYIFGQNAYSMNNYAEYYSLPHAGKASGFNILVAAAYNNSGDANYAKITVKLWDKGSDGKPGTLLYAEDFPFSRFNAGYWNTLSFAGPVTVPAEFFIGYEVYYHPTNEDLFVAACAGNRSSGKNTTYFYSGSWRETPSFVSLNTSIAISPDVCTFAPEAAFEYNTAPEGRTVREIAFTNNTVNGSGPAGYHWDFGDGRESTEANPVHTYASAGEYTVVLTAWNVTDYTTATEVVAIPEFKISGEGTIAWSDAGLNTMEDDDVAIDADVEVDEGVSVRNIIVSAGKKLTVANGATLTAGAITLENDAAHGPATFINEGTASIGSAKVEQYLQTIYGENKREWYYLASPVTGVSSGVFGENSKVGKYDEATSWSGPFSSPEPLDAGRGYIVQLGGEKENPVYTLAGTLNSGTISIPVTRTNGTAPKRGYNLAGNPYPSYLDWDMVDKTNVLPTVWYRSYDGSSMVFDYYNAANGVGVNNSGQGNLSELIPPLQAFWVKVRPEKSGTGGLTLDFTEAMCAHRDAAGGILRAGQAKARIAAPEQPVLRLEVSNGINTDRAVIVFSGSAAGGIDDNDSPKMSNDNKEIPEIYTVADGEKLAINGLPDSYKESGEIVLGFRSGKAGIYTLSASGISNIPGMVLLKDKLLDTETDLAAGEAYTFASEETDSTGRFALLFRPSGTAGQPAPQRIWAYAGADGTITVRSGERKDASLVQVYNIRGQEVASQRLGGSETVVLGHVFATGVYLVRVGNDAVKVIVK
jgi:M6 family metalloprotease-like protein